MRKHLVIGLAALALVAIIFGTRMALADSPGSTSAVPPPPTPAITPSPQPDTSADETVELLRYCIIGPGHPPQCFATQAEALRIASGGQIQLAPDETLGSLSAAELFSTDIQAILFEHTNYVGSTLTVYSDGCYGWNNMPDGWNDRVSSAWTGPCGITLYEHYNLTGRSLRINPPGTPYVGDAMNDQASSFSLP